MGEDIGSIVLGMGVVGKDPMHRSGRWGGNRILRSRAAVIWGREVFGVLFEGEA